MTTTFRWNADEINALIAAMALQGHAFYAPVYRAVRDQDLALMLVRRGVRRVDWPPYRPRLAIIGDDDDTPTGPAGFPRKMLRALFAKAPYVLVHGTGATEGQYALATEAAVLLDLAVVVETNIPTHRPVNGTCIAVLDPDVKNDAPGFASLQKLDVMYGESDWLETRTVETTTGGQHLYFRVDAPIAGRNGLLPGLDVKAGGPDGGAGFVVAPGSTIDGKSYRLIKDVPLRRLPAGVVALIGAPQTKAADRTAQAVAELDDPADPSPQFRASSVKYDARRARRPLRPRPSPEDARRGQT